MGADRIHSSHETERALYSVHPMCKRCGALAGSVDGFAKLLEPCPGETEDRGGCDCSASLAGNGRPHHPTCPMYVIVEPVSRIRLTIGDPATGSGDFSLGGALWPGTSKMIEEQGELLQVLGKLMGSEGRTDHWSGDLIPMMEDELADVLAATKIFIELNPKLNRVRIDERAAEKMRTFREWHHSTLAARK